MWFASSFHVLLHGKGEKIFIQTLRNILGFSLICRFWLSFFWSRLTQKGTLFSFLKRFRVEVLEFESRASADLRLMFRGREAISSQAQSRNTPNFDRESRDMPNFGRESPNLSELGRTNSNNFLMGEKVETYHYLVEKIESSQVLVGKTKDKSGTSTRDVFW